MSDELKDGVNKLCAERSMQSLLDEYQAECVGVMPEVMRKTLDDLQEQLDKADRKLQKATLRAEEVHDMVGDAICKLWTVYVRSLKLEEKGDYVLQASSGKVYRVPKAMSRALRGTEKSEAEPSPYPTPIYEKATLQ